jgi:diacylglycerol kinase (ATP)
VRTLLIVNRKAGRRFVLDLLLPQVLRLLDRGGVSYRVFYTRRSGHATRIVRRYREGVDFVTVVGGDGTVREAVKGMGEKPLPLGIVPFGTVNVLAQDLGIPLNPMLATSALLSGQLRRIDVGYLNEEPFLLMVSTGRDAMAVYHAGGRLKRYFGQLTYVAAGIWSAFVDRPRRIRVELEEEGIRDRGYLVIVSNSRYYGGRYRIGDKIRIDDGLLNVILFKKRGLLDTLRLLAGVITNRHRYMRDVVFYTGRVVRVSARGRMRMQMDGDRAPSGPARIWVRQRFLPVFVPAKAGRQEGLEGLRTVLANVFAPPVTHR